MTIFQPWNSGLGDQIATISLLARKACAGIHTIHLARRDRGPLHDELFDAFQHTYINSVEGEGDTALSGFDVWSAPTWPTRERWREFETHNYYVYQFDGISAPEKNPPQKDVERITSSIPLLALCLGKHTPIDKAVTLLANAAFFVGCDSGFSHLSHCVGTPTFILEYGLPIVTTHRNKPHIPCAGAGDFLDWKLPAWTSYRQFIGPGL